MTDPLYYPPSSVVSFIHGEEIGQIRSKLSGTNKLYVDKAISYTLPPGSVWRRPKEICRKPLFVDGEPSRFDALQGKLADCWLIAAIEEITLNKKLFKHVVPPDQNFGHNYVGAFHFRIWRLGKWYDVVVDDRLPFFTEKNRLCYCNSRSGDVFWAALLEKAYLKACTVIYSLAKYEDLAYGVSMTSLQDFSGGIVERIKLIDFKLDKQSRWWMADLAWREALMCLGSAKTEIEGSTMHTPTGLKQFHAYVITKVFRSEEDSPYQGLFLIRVMNPHGHGEWSGPWSDNDYDTWRQMDNDIRRELEFVVRDDGEFWMDEKSLVKYFKFAFVCHLGPGQFLSSHFHYTSIDSNHWETVSFKGEWVQPFTSGGSRIEYRNENNQYFVQFECRQNAPRSKGDVVVDLVHRSKKGRSVRPSIAFYIYSVKDSDSMPLDWDFISKNDPIFSPDIEDFENSEGRAFVKSLVLELGKYCIIPCTRVRDQESLFLLRIFSELRTLPLASFHHQISKLPPEEEQNLIASDERLTRIFYDVVETDSQIDWIRLKEIFYAMNARYSFTIFSIFNFLKDILTKLLSSNYSDGNDLVFTKDECRKMIAMLDTDKSGKIGFEQFCDLWGKINRWIKVYEQYKDVDTGYLTTAQLREALGAIGYNITKRTAHSLRYVYADDQGNICLTDFILCGVTLETVVNRLKKEDEEIVHEYTLTIEELIRNTLIL